MTNKQICKLTAKQLKAFNQLKKAYQKCLDSGIYFYNYYGSLYAFDKDKINSVDNIEYHYTKGLNEISNSSIDAFTQTPLKIEGEWTDDAHVLFKRVKS